MAFKIWVECHPLFTIRIFVSLFVCVLPQICTSLTQKPKHHYSTTCNLVRVLKNGLILQKDFQILAPLWVLSLRHVCFKMSNSFQTVIHQPVSNVQRITSLSSWLIANECFPCVSHASRDFHLYLLFQCTPGLRRVTFLAYGPAEWLHGAARSQPEITLTFLQAPRTNYFQGAHDWGTVKVSTSGHHFLGQLCWDRGSGLDFPHRKFPKCFMKADNEYS